MRVNVLLQIVFLSFICLRSIADDPWSAWRKTVRSLKSDYERSSLIKSDNDEKTIIIEPGGKGYDYQFQNKDKFSSFEIVIRFRIDKVPEKLISGDGSLFRCVFGKGKTYIAFTVQACYQQDGSWNLNGLYLRDNGQKSRFEKIILQAGPAQLRYGYKIDTKWQELSCVCAKGSIAIKWDGNNIFKAQSNKLDFDYFNIITCPLQKKFGKLYLGSVNVYELEPSENK